MGKEGSPIPTQETRGPVPQGVKKHWGEHRVPYSKKFRTASLGLGALALMFTADTHAEVHIPTQKPIVERHEQSSHSREEDKLAMLHRIKEQQEEATQHLNDIREALKEEELKKAA